MAKSRKYIKKKKYFIGGLIAAGLGMKAIKEKFKKDKQEEGDDIQNGGGKILKVKVIGEGSSSQTTAKKTAEDAEKAKKDGIDPIKAGANDTTKMRKGGIAKARKYVKGGTLGLWANIHAKRKRIKEGSGEKMRKKGSKGAPTDKALKESKAEKGAVVFNKPKRTPSHPTKSHVVIVRKPGGGKKTIRFGQQGKTGDKTMTPRAKSFKARHGKNIAKGKTSAAYWANKVKWEDGGINKPKKTYVKTMEQDLLEGAGVSTSKRHKNRVRGVLHSKEEALYTALGRKAPKRNIFKKGGSVKKKHMC